MQAPYSRVYILYASGVAPIGPPWLDLHSGISNSVPKCVDFICSINRFPADVRVSAMQIFEHKPFLNWCESMKTDMPRLFVLNKVLVQCSLLESNRVVCLNLIDTAIVRPLKNVCQCVHDAVTVHFCLECIFYFILFLLQQIS